MTTGPSSTANPDILDSSQLFQARIKANEVLQEHLKQVVTVASATLALTITFLKEVIGPAKASIEWSGLLPASWVMLSLSIGFAVWTIAVLVNNLDGPHPTDKTKSFAAGGRLDVAWLTLGAFTVFGAGMLCLGIFAAKNYELMLRRDQSEFVVASASQAVSKAKQGLKQKKNLELVTAELIRGPEGSSNKDLVWHVKFQERRSIKSGKGTYVMTTPFDYFVSPTSGLVTKVP